MVFTCQQELDAGEEYARRAVDRQPGLSWALLKYANVLDIQGNGDEARDTGALRELEYARSNLAADFDH